MPNSDNTKNDSGKSGPTDSLQRDPEGVVSDFHKKKLHERRIVWEFNHSLAVRSGIIAGLLAVAAIGSYTYHSVTAPSTFLRQADAASERGDLDGEVQWLSRYLMIKPGDPAQIARIGYRTDLIAETVTRDELVPAVQRARRQLATSIATLDEDQELEQKKLRRLLIRRLLQLGGSWFREVERQVVLLNADPDDAAANKALALAVYGQIQRSVYESRNPTEHSRNTEYWDWLSDQLPGVIFETAIEVNPGDVELISAYLTLVRRQPALGLPVKPRLNEITDEEERKSASAQYQQSAARAQATIGDAIGSLSAEASSRASLALYFYGIEGTDEQKSKARQLLLSAGDQAARNLELFQSASDADSLSPPPPESLLHSDSLNLGRRLDGEYWDYVCLLQAARLGWDSETLDEQEKPEQLLQQTARWYELLEQFQHKDVSATIRRNTFLDFGRFEVSRGNVEAGIAIWERGLDEINRDNLDILGAIVIALADKNERDAEETRLAVTRLEEFETAIETSRGQLIKKTTSEIGSGERRAIGRRIDLAEWRAGVARAQLLISCNKEPEAYSEAIEKLSSGNTLTAIGLLDSAFRSATEVSVEERVNVAMTLGRRYTLVQAWDQAAEMFSSACELMPGNPVFHAQAADAWTRAGNVARAMDHWRMVQNSPSILTRVAALQGEFDYEFRKPSDLQNFADLRDRLTRLRAELDQRLAIEESNEDLQELLKRADVSLRMSQLLLPPPGVNPAEHLRSTQLADGLVLLAEEYPDAIQVQSYAAERLAAAGRKEESDQAVQRLKRLSDDPTSVEVLLARIDAIEGEYVVAAERLRDHIGEAPGDVSRLANSAANYARLAGDDDLAYRILQSIPVSSRTPRDLFELFALARELDLAEDVEKWRAELVRREGSDGTYWRFIDASELTASLLRLSAAELRNNPDLTRAKRIVNELNQLRPRWGKAIALRGWLEAIQGQTEHAVEDLKLAIDAGDQRRSTQRLYWEQLIRLGRDKDADEAIRQASSVAGMELDPYGRLQITAAVRRDDTMAALETAREGVRNHPDDPFALMVVAKVASYVVSRMQNDPTQSLQSTPEQRQQLVQEARLALDRARELSGGGSFGLASGRLDLELRHGDAGTIDAELDRIKSSDLGERDRLLLIGRVHVYRGELEEAVDVLERADRARATSETRLTLAGLYRRLNRIDDQIGILREALKEAPDNASIREQLANAIIQRDGDDVDWREIESILASGSRVDPANRLLYAMLLAAKGEFTQQQQALKLLSRIEAENNSRSYSAAIVKAALLLSLADQLAEASEADEEQIERYVAQARNVYQRHAESADPSVDDLFRYAVFLITRGDEEDKLVAKSVADQLKATRQGVLRSLELEVAMRRDSGIETEMPEWLDEWAEGSSGIADETELDVAAGAMLLRLGYTEQAVKWFRKAYAANPSSLTNLVVALTRAQDFDEAAAVAVAHFKKFKDSRSPMLLIESLLAAPKKPLSEEYSELLSEATRLHPRNVTLLESVATWAMQQGRVQDAITLFRRTQTIDPLRIRTLNNLAMAYSQHPELASEGIKPIEQAIRLAGEIPELLDTKATVLLAAGDADSALAILDDIITKTGEPRYQFHKILALVRLKKRDEAARLWQELEKDRVDVKALTPDEQVIWEQMVDSFQDYGSE